MGVVETSSNSLLFLFTSFFLLRVYVSYQLFIKIHIIKIELSRVIVLYRDPTSGISVEG